MLDLSDRIVVMRQGRVIAMRQTQTTNKRQLSGLIAGIDHSGELAIVAKAVDLHDRYEVNGSKSASVG